MNTLSCGAKRGLKLDNQRLEHDDFLRLLLKSEREILRYVMAIVPHVPDAQEIVQETAVALWKQCDQYDSSQPFTPWACRFAANKAKEYLRKKGRWNHFLDDDIASMLLARREKMAPQLDRRMAPLRDCVSELPTGHRSLLEKYYFDQTPVEEISQEVGRSAEAVYKSLQRIRTGLMDCVNGKLISMEGS